MASPFTAERLQAAWKEVLANDLDDGVLSAGVARFGQDADERIEELADELAAGSYEPRDVTECRIWLGKKERTLHIPPVRDRIVERAILEYLTPIVDPLLGPFAYAYRPGIGVDDAVQALVGLREEGLGWVLRTDIKDCFPNLPVALARRRIETLIDRTDVEYVVGRLFERLAVRKGGRRNFPGLPQGSPLSPLLANLVLVDVDTRLAGAGFPVVRYADDLAVAASSQAEAWEAARVCSAAVEELNMDLGVDKTQVMSFDEGFAFLGEDFGPRYPPVLEDAGVREPDRKVLYVAKQGARVRVRQGRVFVEKEDAPILDVPTSLVERIVLFGSVGLSAGARTWAMASDVDVVLASRRGNYLGVQVSGAWPARSQRVRAQLALGGTEQELRIGRGIADSKIRHQIVVLQRFGRRDHSEQVRETVSQMRQFREMLPDAKSRDEIMGLEGATAAVYWPTYGSLFPEDLRFKLRTRQPPRDVPNSALGYLYTVLLGECVTAVQGAGLDPGIGILHSVEDRKPSLALDLMEEFRPLIVDRVVLSMARHQRLTASHGREPAGKAGILLTAAGREAVVTAYEAMALTTAKGAAPDFTGSWRRHIHRQAHQLRACILNPELNWRGLSWR